MKKTIRKIILIMLCLCFALGAFAVIGGAMSINEGVDSLRTLWSRGNGPKVGKWDIDYSYYSPVDNGADPSLKYPLVVIMAGAGEGDHEGLELQANNMPKWTADEYQQRFTNGASYMFIARAPEEDGLYWDSRDVIPSLKAAVDDFCAKNPNVDTNRIYCIGWCLGGTGVIELTSAYPKDFAAAVIMCPNRSLTSAEVNSLKNTPVWYMGCTADTYSLYSTCVKSSWNALTKASECRGDLRLTSCSKAPDVYLAIGVKFIGNHNMWENAAEDMHYMGSGYADLKTVDGDGNEISDPYLISWLCSFTSENKQADGKTDNSGSAAQKIRNFFRNIIFKFLTIIYKLLGKA